MAMGTVEPVRMSVAWQTICGACRVLMASGTVGVRTSVVHGSGWVCEPCWEQEQAATKVAAVALHSPALADYVGLRAPYQMGCQECRTTIWSGDGYFQHGTPGSGSLSWMCVDCYSEKVDEEVAYGDWRAAGSSGGRPGQGTSAVAPSAGTAFNVAISGNTIARSGTGHGQQVGPASQGAGATFPPGFAVPGRTYRYAGGTFRLNSGSLVFGPPQSAHTSTYTYGYAPGVSDEPEVFPVQDVPILGYRFWTLPHGGTILRSINQSEVWEPRVVQVASCTRGYHHARVPEKDCTCGIYARFSYSGAEGYVHAGSHIVTNDGILVAGIIGMWGLVRPGETGLKAEKARILGLGWHYSLPGTVMAPGMGTAALTSLAVNFERVRRVADIYGVPFAIGTDALSLLGDTYKSEWELESAAAQVEVGGEQGASDPTPESGRM